MAKNVSGKDYKPFIPAEKIMPEFTVESIIVGIILAIVFGAANAYLGLKVGLTISASIPAAVISMAIIRVIMKKDSILENNMVQTIGSAGESLAAGVIFTLPAMFLWSKEWGTASPSLFVIAFIALCGGTLGTLFMIPLRKALIVEEHGNLPYPEGTACAEVLLAGEEGGQKAKTTFLGLGIGALYKFINGGLGLFPSEIETTIPGYKNAAIGMDALPALLGVGYIVGPKISGYMLSGAILAWLGLIPMISNFGGHSDFIMFPATVPISELNYSGIWNHYIRYIGAGAVAFGGVFSLIKSLPLIITTFRDALKDLKKSSEIDTKLRTEQDLSMKIVLLGSLAVIIIMAFTPIIPVGIEGAIIIAVFGFFFATVSSRIVGLIGSSNNPVSGMTIATLLITAMIFKASGVTGQEGMLATLSVGAVICIVAAMAGDTSQDLKTGFLVGATPRKQQIGEMIGAVFAALTIGFVLVLLNKAWGFGSKELAAPQATLMKLVIEGVMGGNLPWPLVFTGVGIGVAIEVIGIPVLPVAIGLYLPIHLSTPIMVGGIVRGLLDRKSEKASENQEHLFKYKVESGVLYSSGLIAGEGLLGIILAGFAVANINLGNLIGGINLGAIGTIIFFGALIASLVKFSHHAKLKS